ncbi:MAG: hypothetical protein KatS3mg077_2027 [Candidatus Binatia bacterium]|nr:MAG: hypothetical protein KatS3mg077_2027 [Candidatus Binatia bacterium]
MGIDPRNYDTTVVLRDGTSIRIRAIRPDDKQRLLDHFQSLSERSVYFRFFSAKKRLTDEELVRFTEPDFVTHVALVATLLIEGEEKIIGVGRFIVPPGGDPHRAEVAFAVSDAYQGRGIGTALLEHLALIARELGVTEFEANVLGENNQMLEVFARSGFRVARTVEGGIVHVSFPTAETTESRAAAETRERQAIAQSIRPFFYPRAVAVDWGVEPSQHGGPCAGEEPEGLRIPRAYLSRASARRGDPRVARLPPHCRRGGTDRPRRHCCAGSECRGSGPRVRACGRASARGHFGGFWRKRAGRSRARAAVAPARPGLGHAHGGPQLSRPPQHRSDRVAQRHLCANVPPARQYQHALAKWRVGLGDSRHGSFLGSGHCDLRFRRQQGRRLG